jgi:S1/P1 Nuclease
VVARSHLVPLRLMNPHLPSLCSVAVLLQASPGLAWGDMGHRIICEIAFQELNDTARQRVKALIRRDPEFDTFAEACSWPDHPRHRAEEHYVNLPRDALGFV